MYGYMIAYKASWSSVNVELFYYQWNDQQSHWDINSTLVSSYTSLQFPAFLFGYLLHTDPPAIVSVPMC